MRTFKNITAITIITLTAIFCLAQFNPGKSAMVCKKCQSQATVTSINEVEDFSLVSLLTLKFM